MRHDYRQGIWIGMPANVSTFISRFRAKGQTDIWTSSVLFHRIFPNCSDLLFHIDVNVAVANSRLGSANIE